ncbi:uncharacterized protein [Dermacentor albipictus]|uniref:uncharacterized protein isoform X5 n=1 Tax=Dermacentor albipictus TaxID=60249 RepID=UPI0038FC50BD
MWQDTEDFLQRIRDVGPRAKSGIQYDVQCFFDHVKIQVCMTVGDCRAFYGLYSSTLNTLCNQGVRLYVCTTVGDCRAFYGLYSSTLNPLCNQGVRLYEFIKESVKSWTNVCQDIDASTKRIRDLSLRAKSGMTYDVARFFEDVKIEASRKKGSVAPDLLFPLVLQSPGPVIFAVFALLLTVAVPLCGLAVLRKRCRERPQQKETSFICPPDSVGKTMFSLWILAVCLTIAQPVRGLELKQHYTTLHGSVQETRHSTNPKHQVRSNGRAGSPAASCRLKEL